MKIIDLLNKIANGEEDDLITEFEFDERVWNFKKLNDSEFCLDGWLLNQNITITKHKEILEEEKKIPEKFKVHSLGDKDKNGNFVSSPFPTDEEFMNKINDIIDYLQYIKSKGDE